AGLQTLIVTTSVLLLFRIFPIVNNPANTSALVSLMALFLALYRTLAWTGLKGVGFFRRSFVIAMVSAGLMSLKSTAIPPTVITLTIFYSLCLASSASRRDVTFEALSAAALTALFLFPWMLSMYHSSGTL